MSTKTMVIGVVALVAVLGVWRFVAGRVDRTDANAVGTAFLSALKGNDLDKASGFWVPDGSEAWLTSASTKVEQMQSGTHERFFEDIPKRPAFVSTRKTGAPANEQTLTSGGTSVDVRQIDGKWYVFKAPL